MQISVLTTDNMRREELDASQILKIEFRIGDTVFAVRERDGELCISIDGQLAIKPVGANLISLSAGRIG